MILVTGGCGFIGANFIRDRLAVDDEPVVNLDKLTYAGNPENLDGLAGDDRYHFVRGDIGETAQVASLLARYRPRAVVNFAAESHVDRSIAAPEAFIETNVAATSRLLEAVRGYWAALKPQEQERFRFLHVSTDEVYGSLGAEDPAFCETTAYAPNSPYSASKAASDHLVRAWGETYSLPVLTTHCSNNYGPFQFPEKLIPLVIGNALAEKPLPIYGDGGNIRDWLYVADHCRALTAVLERGRTGATYVIGGRAERTNLAVVRALCAILDRLHPRAAGRYADLIQYVTDRPGHDRRYAIDPSRIERELGWQPRESFDSGLEKTVRWYLAHQPWVDRVTSGAYQDWVARHYGRPAAHEAGR